MYFTFSSPVRKSWDMINSVVVMWDKDPNQTLIIKVSYDVATSLANANCKFEFSMVPLHV